jgi:N-acyl-D-aspartate/D-glutamate deacylase
MTDAIHRLSGLPATNLGLDHRGFLKEGMFADVVVFQPFLNGLISIIVTSALHFLPIHCICSFEHERVG